MSVNENLQQPPFQWIKCTTSLGFNHGLQTSGCLLVTCHHSRYCDSALQTLLRQQSFASSPLLAPALVSSSLREQQQGWWERKGGRRRISKGCAMQGNPGLDWSPVWTGWEGCWRHGCGRQVSTQDLRPHFRSTQSLHRNFQWVSSHHSQVLKHSAQQKLLGQEAELMG